MNHTRWPFCRLCTKVAVLRDGDACLRCMGAMEADLEPITWAATTARPTRWRRMWLWLENRFPELGDFAREDDE